MVELSVLDGFVVQCAPLWQEVPVLKIDLCAANQVISEEVIVVHRIDEQHGTAREDRLEVVVFAELGIGLIQNVVLLLIINLLAQFQNQVGVRESTHISTSQIKSLNHVNSHDALLGLQQHALQNDIALYVCKDVHDVEVVHLKWVELLFDLVAAFHRFQLFKVKVKVIYLTVFRQLFQTIDQLVD